MASKCPELKSMSQREREVLRELVSKLRAVEKAQDRIKELTPLGAKILKASGGTVRVGPTVIEVDYIQRVIYSAKVESLARKLEELKAKERADGLFTQDPAKPTIKIFRA